MEGFTARSSKKSQAISEAVMAEGAEILFGAVFNFLFNCKLDRKLIERSARRAHTSARRGGEANTARKFRSVLRVYEELGTIISTWHSNARFVDDAGNPIPLSTGRGSLSIRNLVRASGTKVPYRIVVKLMRISPTIKEDDRGMVAVSRFFSLPGFELLRAGLVIERFLETLYSNTVVGGEGSKLIFERNCYADGIKPEKLALLLRDVKHRGTAFMDSVDGQIESGRSGSSKKLATGELGVFMFAWTRLPTSRRGSQALPRKARSKMA